MGFTNQEYINQFTKALSAGVIDANPFSVWYETYFPFKFILSGDSVWTQLSSVPSAGSLASARTNATNNPTIISDLSQNASAIRLTEVAGTNGSTWAAYSTYNDTTSDLLINWLLPQIVPQSDGSPSNGYAISLYDGDPATTGSLVTTTSGTSGTGVNKSVGWIFNYGNGLLFLAQDFLANVSNPYIVGFRYIGNTAGSGVSTTAVYLENEFVADETLAVGEIVRVVQSGDVGLTVGRVIKANDTTGDSCEAIGIALGSGNQGNNIKVAINGKVKVKFASAPSNSDIGKKVYLSSTSGKGTFTIPSATGKTVVLIGTLIEGNGSTNPATCILQIEELITLG